MLSSVPKDLGIISEILWKSEVGQSMWFMILSVLHLAVLEDLLRRVWGHGTLELEGSVSELWFSCLQLEFHFIFFSCNENVFALLHYSAMVCVFMQISDFCKLCLKRSYWDLSKNLLLVSCFCRFFMLLLWSIFTELVAR